MSLKMEYHLKWNVTQDKISFRIECHLNGISLKWNVSQTGMSLKKECHSNEMSLKMGYYST